jgi:hypothetical protein
MWWLNFVNMTKHMGVFVPEISKFQLHLKRTVLSHLESANARRHGLPEDLDEELAWWGNAPFEWAFDGHLGQFHRCNVSTAKPD